MPGKKNQEMRWQTESLWHGGARARRQREWGAAAHDGSRGYSGGDKRVLTLDGGDGYSGDSECP